MYRTVLTLAAGLLIAGSAAAGEDRLAAKAAEPAGMAEATTMTAPKPDDDAKPTDVDTETTGTATEDEKEVIAKTAPAATTMPVNGRIIHQADAGKLCIGGVLCAKFCSADDQDCEPTENLTIKLDEPTRISTIQLSAHDNIGKTRRSRLVVKVNGKPIAETLVYKLGSTLSIDVGETGELITIESAHQYNGFLRGGEEAVIWDVYVFGGEGAEVATPEPDA